MIDATTFFTIVLMAGVTYLTRIGGYVVLRNRTLSGRATAVMEAAPGCVLIAVIAPAFVEVPGGYSGAGCYAGGRHAAFHAADCADRSRFGGVAQAFHRLERQRPVGLEALWPLLGGMYDGKYFDGIFLTR